MMGPWIFKVDGHVAVEGQKKFSFPVGYDDTIRPLQIEFADDIFYAKCEYFHENPDYPESFRHKFRHQKVGILVWVELIWRNFGI